MWRRVAAWVLVVLTAIAVTGSIIGFWVHRTVLDTDAFMTSVTPIVESESVQAVVADRVGDQIVDALDIEARLTERLTQAESRLLDRLAEALELPDAIVQRLANSRLGLDSLAPMVAAGVETRIREAVERFVTSPEGSQLLLRTIEIAHERSVLLLRDEMDQLPNVVVAEGEVRLNLVPLIGGVLRSVVNAGLDFIGIEREIPAFESSEDATAAVQRLAGVLGRDLPADFGQVRLGSEASLERAQGLVRAFDLALWALLIAAVLLAVAAVWLAPSVPSGLIRVGIAATVAAAVGWLIVQLLSAQVVEAATTPDGRVAIGEIVTALVNGLSATTLVLAIIGIGVVALGIIADRRGAEPAAAAVTPGGAPSAPIAAPAAPQPVESGTPPDPATPASVTPPAKAAPPAKPATKPASAKATSAKQTSGKPAPKPRTTSTTQRRRRPPAAGA
jgi:hypothetical protein